MSVRATGPNCPKSPSMHAQLRRSSDRPVDTADYVVWRNWLNQSGPNLPADGDHDGTIDADDYNVWRGHFGESAGRGSGYIANAAIPEPATSILMLLTASGWYLRRRFASSRVTTTRRRLRHVIKPPLF
jgi:hypothetical protein